MKDQPTNHRTAPENGGQNWQPTVVSASVLLLTRSRLHHQTTIQIRLVVFFSILTFVCHLFGSLIFGKTFYFPCCRLLRVELDIKGIVNLRCSVCAQFVSAVCLFKFLRVHRPTI